MTQGLLTLGTIPATSGDTPRYPEESQRQRERTLRGDAAQLSNTILNLVGCDSERCCWGGERGGSGEERGSRAFFSLLNWCFFFFSFCQMTSMTAGQQRLFFFFLPLASR